MTTGTRRGGVRPACSGESTRSEPRGRAADTARPARRAAPRRGGGDRPADTGDPELGVGETITWRALDLLRNANLHGHKYAIDSVVAATALGYSGPRIIVTSDADDLIKLCGERVTVVAA